MREDLQRILQEYCIITRSGLNKIYSKFHSTFDQDINIKIIVICGAFQNNKSQLGSFKMSEIVWLTGLYKIPMTIIKRKGMHSLS